MGSQNLRALLLLISCSVAFACHGTLLETGVTEEEKRIILQEHNKLRQYVATGHVPGQPSAGNMREIVWDEELAARAQEWANNCQFKHDPKRNIDRFTMGQNLGIIWSTIPLEEYEGDFPTRIRAWFNEVQKYSFGGAWSPKTGHYSQLIWGETDLIGCGYSHYKDGSKYSKLYVCNYGPGGNVVGVQPYKVGHPACRNYGLNPSPKYQGLCSAGGSSVGVLQNTIDTYEYKQNDLNAKPTFSPQKFNANPQQAIRQNPLPSTLQRTEAVRTVVQSVQPADAISATSHIEHTVFRSFLSSVPQSQAHAEVQAELISKIQAAQAQRLAAASAATASASAAPPAPPMPAAVGGGVEPVQPAETEPQTQPQPQIQPQPQTQFQTRTHVDPYSISTIQTASTTTNDAPEPEVAAVRPQSGWSLLTWRG